MTDQQLNQFSNLLSALTNPIWLRIVPLLQAGELAINQLSQRLYVVRNHIFQLLATLTASGLLLVRRAGKQLV